MEPQHTSQHLRHLAMCLLLLRIVGVLDPKPNVAIELFGSSVQKEEDALWAGPDTCLCTQPFQSLAPQGIKIHLILEIASIV